jgi:hypothetical protein
MGDDMSEVQRNNDTVDLIHKRINELREDFKMHCSDADARIRHLEEASVKSDVLLEQFVSMQQRQSDTNDRLNVTLTTLDNSMNQMEKSLKGLFLRTDKTEIDVVQLQKETALIPELKTKADLNASLIEKNENLHKVDLRTIEKRETEQNWKKPVIITGGIAGVLAVIGMLVKILIDITALYSAMPK